MPRLERLDYHMVKAEGGVLTPAYANLGRVMDKYHGIQSLACKGGGVKIIYFKNSPAFNSMFS